MTKPHFTKRPRYVWLLVASLLFLSLRAGAEIRLPAILGSDMVLQRNTEVTLWGWCDPAEKILIAADWLSSPIETVGTNGAKWSIRIPTPDAGGPYTISISGSSTVTLDNILIGEVWLCAGQSNMEWSAAHGLVQASEEVPHAFQPKIRLFNVSKSTATHPQEDLDGVWTNCTPETMKTFSAVAYFFGKKLTTELNVPVGLICSAWSGTPAEVWTPNSVFSENHALRTTAERLVEYPWRPRDPASCYNAMIHPLTPLRISGVIWYQGESNVDDYRTYDQLFSSLIRSWRANWQSELPFYYVQIAPFRYARKYVGALLREAQARCEIIPGTAMIVIDDLVDDTRNIHPDDKKGVGERLAGMALARVYGGTDGLAKRPRLRNMTREGNHLRLHFDHAEGGLVSSDGQPSLFMIAGIDRHFLPAQSRIEGSTVVVWHGQISSPVAVRFAFENEARSNLIGERSGLPVSLFRTDNWTLESTEQ